MSSERSLLDVPNSFILKKRQLSICYSYWFCFNNNKRKEKSRDSFYPRTGTATSSSITWIDARLSWETPNKETNHAAKIGLRILQDLLMASPLELAKLRVNLVLVGHWVDLFHSRVEAIHDQGPCMASNTNDESKLSFAAKIQINLLSKKRRVKNFQKQKKFRRKDQHKNTQTSTKNWTRFQLKLHPSQTVELFWLFLMKNQWDVCLDFHYEIVALFVASPSVKLHLG